MHLCHLPSEVLDQILARAILIPAMLRRQRSPLQHREKWEGTPDERHEPLPSLFLVNKKLSQASIARFYDNAVLETEPIIPSKFILDHLNSALSFDLTTNYSLDYAFCPHLWRIKRVRLLSGQRDAINAEGYEATLRWLVQNTGVQEITLSRRLMLRVRIARANPESALTALSSLNGGLSRVVYIWTRHRPCIWERERRAKMTQLLGGTAPPALQMYLYRQDCLMEPFLDPRWDLRKSDTLETRTLTEPITKVLDDMAANNVTCQRAHNVWEPHEGGIPPVMRLRLYQVCFVVGSS
jgi:hypothetical protein